MSLEEFLKQFTEDQWADEENRSPKIIWNTAIIEAMNACQKEIDVLMRSNQFSYATGAIGCKNAIEELLST